MKRKSMILAGLVLCFVLALGLIGGGSVAEGNPTGHTHDGITFIEWTDELAAQQNGAGKTAYNSLPSLPGSYYLTWNVYLTEPWVVPGTVNLCLNENVICLDSIITTAQAIEVTSGTFSLYESGTICNRSYGAGVKISGGSFIMYAATIKDNTNGIYVAEGASFTMYGGEISTNRDGGIVNAGVFTMYGGTIKENSLESSNKCGAGVRNSGIFNMTSGTIKNNTSTEYPLNSEHCGAGVYNTGSFTMSGGTISGNKLTGRRCKGGGVYNAGTFTMSGCTITGNELGGNTECQGGGVYNADTGTFTMTNCIVSENKVIYESLYSEGGGIYNAGTFIMNHGTIGANRAYAAGGGVYNAGTFTVSGSATITGNTNTSSDKNNVFLEGYKKIRIGGKLTTGASIGVRRPNTGVFTDGFSKTGNNPGEDPTTYFFKDDVNNINVFIEADLATGEARLTGTPRHDDGDGQYAHYGWTGITSLSEITANGYYYLTQDVTLIQGWTLPRERDIHLCLNGHNIILNANDDVITFDYVHTLDLYDCRGGGCIIHGTGYTGRGVVFRGSGIMNMHGGIISGNVIDGFSDGAGVFMDGGEFNLCGGTISGNTSNDRGGGVYVSGGTFNMTCGTISGNKSRNFGGGVAVFNGQFSLSGGLITGNQSTDDYGGGVYVAKYGTFTMSGGEISRNQSRGDGGGICNFGTFTLSGGMISGNQTAAVGFGGGICHWDGTFSLSGSPLVSGNSAGYNRGKDIYLDNNLLITVTGEMSNETPLPLLKEDRKDGVFTNTADTDTAYNEASRFASEDSRYLVGKNTAGQLLLGVPCTLTYYGNNAVRGAVPVDGPYAQGAMVTIPGNTGNLERDGYTFGGWNSQADGQGTPYAAGESFDIATDMSFYAVWIPIPPVEPTIATQPADVEMVYGETGKTVSVSVTADAGTTYTLSYAWFPCDSAGVAAAAAETVGTDAAYAIPADLDAGTYYYKCTVTATRDDNGESVSVNSSPATVTVNRATAVISTPTANDRYYDGKEAPLLAEEVTTSGGTVRYALGSASDLNPPAVDQPGTPEEDRTWQTGIPKGTDAAAYYVWIKAFGDKNYDDSNAQRIVAKIVIPVTFRVVDGEWDSPRSGSDPIILPLSRYENEDTALVLTDGDIPAVGHTPAEEYDTSGSWDTAVMPPDKIISVPMVFTFSYNKLPEATVLTEPEGKNLTYSGQEQELVTAGKTQTGTMQYAIGENNVTAPDLGWDSEIPGKTLPGTYYVWFRVKGDNQHSSTEGKCVTVILAPKKVTITAKSAEKTYDGTALTEAGFTVTDLETGDSHAFKVTMTEGSAITDYGKTGTQPNVIATVDGVAVTTGTETAVGNYLVTTADGTLTVQPKSITGATVTLDKTQLTYNGSEQSVKVTGIAIDGLTLTEDNYTVSGETAGPDKGTYTVTVTGKGNYKDSATAEWSIVEKAMTVSVENVKAEYDGQPHDITVTVTDPAYGATVKYGTTEGTYDLDASPTLTNAGTLPVYFKVTADNYNDYTGNVTITVTKAASAVKTAPKAVENLTEDGKEHELVIDGEADGGTLAYALGNADGATGEYSASIPTGTEGGTYYVWYKVIGDENHNDSKAEYVTSTIRSAISHTVTFKVVHGAWGDGTREDKTVIVTGFEGDELRLQLADIPKVDKPDEGYVFGTGKWSPYDPPVIYQGEVSGDPITEDMTFTYTYGEKTTQDVMVTLKVVHGEWGDELGGRDDRTIFLSGPIGAELRLEFDQIPDVTKPDEGYSMLTGSWDKQPSFILDGQPYGDPITEDTVYTYTYGEIPAAVITKAPVGKKLTYNGKAQELVSAGEAEGGTLVYALGNAKGATEKYTETIPAMINAGIYYVWYKAVGDKDHADTEPACVKAEITGGEEAVTFTRQLYRLVLNREPENLGYDAWVNALASGKTGAVQLIIGFFCSPEYQSQNHTVEDTVCRLYRVILNREPDPEGLQNWAQILAGGTPVTKVIQDMAQTDQFFALCAGYGVDPGIIRGGGEPLPETNPVKIRAYVTACYNGLLGRGPDKDGQESWANALQTGRRNAVQLIAGFMDSEEYKARNLSNGQVVEALYLAMLGRGADAGGLGHWRALLDAGYPVYSVINGIANSNEFAAICKDCGIPAGQLPEGELPQQPVSEYTNEEAIRAFTERCYVAVLGRQGDAEEIDSHARMILSGKVTPAQLIRSFITSGEFKGKLPGNEEYIKILYRAYLNREEDAEGLAFWLTKLNDGTVSPDQLLGEFENSAEFRSIDKALKNE